MRLSGLVVKGDDHYTDFIRPNATGFDALTIWPQRRWEERITCCFEADDVVVTSAFLSIHLPSRRLFIDQSYDRVGDIVPLRPTIADGRFVLDTDPIDLPGRTLVLGGPIDGVWYHWLFNWAPRMLLVRHLRPDVLDDPSTRIAVHPLALEEPFHATLAAFGVPMERFHPLDPARDYRLERAVLVTFPEDNKLYPLLVREMAAAMLDGLDVRRRPDWPDSRRIYASRQPLPPRRRRVANFEEIAPLLACAGFDVVTLGDRSAREQALLFSNADVVLGGHGSDLANMLFCPPGTKIRVLEHHYSVHFRLHRGLQHLAEIMELDYDFIQTPPHRPNGQHPQDRDGFINEDYLVDVATLAATLGED